MRERQDRCCLYWHSSKTCLQSRNEIKIAFTPINLKSLRKSDMLKKDQAAHVKAERDLLAESESPWVVLKFGGTSIGTAERMLQVAEIVK